MAEFVEVTRSERQITCKYCGALDLEESEPYKDTPYFTCKECKRVFSGKDTFPRMKYPKELNVKALTYYYNGMSYRGIAHTFEDLAEYDLPKSTIYRWVLKYSRLVNDYVLSLHPELSDVWLADETMIDIWGQKYWFWDIIDSESRFLIASHLSKTRTTKDATKLFYMARLRSKTRPKMVITDRLWSYQKAFNNVFYSNLPQRRVTHLKSKGFNAVPNTNLIERFHSTLKQRTKVMRDLKTPNSARVILDGFVTHYNFFLEHESLDGATPARAGGLGDRFNDWGDLIESAMATPRENPEVQLEWEEEFNIE